MGLRQRTTLRRPGNDRAGEGCGRRPLAHARVALAGPSAGAPGCLPPRVLVHQRAGCSRGDSQTGQNTPVAGHSGGCAEADRATKQTQPVAQPLSRPPATQLWQATMRLAGDVPAQNCPATPGAPNNGTKFRLDNHGRAPAGRPRQKQGCNRNPRRLHNRGGCKCKPHTERVRALPGCVRTCGQNPAARPTPKG